MKKHLIMLGDSDINNWPKHLIPNLNVDEMHTIARGGATLPDVDRMFEAWIQENSKFFMVEMNGTRRNMIEVFIIACAGENDICQGRSVDSAVNAYHDLMCHIFEKLPQCKRVMFLGPKFEPWLAKDYSTRKQYTKLSKALRRATERHKHVDKLMFIDCLTMFCGETSTLPGAINGDRALADKTYFVEDDLHLNDRGYILWKGEIERHQM